MEQPRPTSKLFSRFDPTDEKNKEFGKDLRTALALPKNERNACVDILAEMRLTTTNSQSERLYEVLEEKTGVPNIVLVKVIGLLKFFLEKFADDKFRSDTSEQWASELVLLKQIQENQRDDLIDLIDGVRAKTLPAVERELLRRRYSGGVLPTMASCGATVEMRAVQRNPYRWTMPADQYNPKILDVVGVVSVHVGLDSGQPKDLFFQVSETKLDLLISQLQAAKKELSALQRFLLSWGGDEKERDDDG